MGKAVTHGSWRSWKGKGRARFEEGRGWIFYIRKRVDGVDYDVCTGVVDDEVFADEHYRQFMRGPKLYHPGRVTMGALGREPLYLADALAVEFLNYLVAPKTDLGRGSSADHARKTHYFLIWWQKQLAGKDLRRLTLEDLNSAAPLGSKIGSLLGKRNAVRTFMNWLRRAGKLARHEGPEMEFFEVPQSRDLRRQGQSVTEMIARENKGSDAKRLFPKVRLALPPHWREHLDLLGGTGLRVRDMARWIEDGAPLEPPDEGTEDAAILPYVGKDKLLHRAALSENALAAAQFVKKWNADRQGRPAFAYNRKTRKVDQVERSKFPYDYFIRAVRKAAERLLEKGEITKEDERALHNFGAGKMRHAVATAAAESQKREQRPTGDMLEAIRQQLGHAPNSAITRRHYIDPSAIVDRPGDGVKLPKRAKAKRVASLI